MKKLLALILCVAMVLSLAPAAFAANDGAVGGIYKNPNADQLDHLYQDTAVAKRVVTSLEKDVKAMYTAIAADETVFGTAKTIYDMTDGMAKELLKDVDKATIMGATIYHDDLVSNLRKGLNNVIGDQIAKYMSDRKGIYTDGNNHFKPDKYLDTFAKAVTDTLTSKKAQANIQEVMYGVLALSAQKAVNDRADDLYTAIVDWDHMGEFGWALGTVDPSVYGYAGAWEALDHTALIGTEAAYNNSGLAASILHGDFNN